jgi:hypothetical protein
MIFLDTGFLLALVSERDENHERAVEVLNSFRGGSLWDQVITTNHVVAEAITAVRFKAEPHNLPKGHASVVEIGRGLFDGAFGRYLRGHHRRGAERTRTFRSPSRQGIQLCRLRQFRGDGQARRQPGTARRTCRPRAR